MRPRRTQFTILRAMMELLDKSIVNVPPRKGIAVDLYDIGSVSYRSSKAAFLEEVKFLMIEAYSPKGDYSFEKGLVVPELDGWRVIC